MGQLLAIAATEARLLLRDPAGLLLLFLLPAIFIVVLSVALQGAFRSDQTSERVPLLVADADDGELGRRVVDALQRSDHFAPVTLLDGRPPTAAQATGAVRDQRFDAAVVVPAGASDALGFDQDATIEVIYDPAISAELSATIEFTLRALVQGATINALQAANDDRAAAIDDLEDRLRGLARACALPRSQPDGGPVEAPSEEWPDYSCDHPPGYWPEFSVQHWGLQVRRVPARRGGGPGLPNSVQQNVPGWTIFALFWIAQILALNLIGERQTGIYRRLRIAPLAFGTYVGGKVVPFLILNLLQALVLFAIGVVVLPLLGCPRLELVDPPLLLLVTLAISCAAVGLGLLIATVARTELMASAGSAALLITMTALGGIMVPKLVMPAALQTVTRFVPHGWALEAYLDVLVRGADLAEVWPELAALLGFGVACFGLALARMRRRGLPA